MRHQRDDAIRFARRELGEAIRAAREEANLRRIDVAKSMGYKNLSKGAWRLSEWEKGASTPDAGQLARLRQVLSIPRLDDLVSRERHAAHSAADDATRRAHADREAALRQWRLLARHVDVLVAARAAISAEPSWARARVAESTVQVAYIGCAALTLGALVSGWAEGWMRHDGALLFSAGGSPLSGRHFLTGLRAGECVRLTRSGWTATGMPALRAARAHCGSTPLGPECVLATLGVHTPSIRIDAPDGTLLAHWRPGDSHVLGEPVQDDLAGSFEERWRKNRRVLASITPARTGEWLGEHLITPDGAIAHSGWLEGPEGQLLAWLERPLPPTAATALARALLEAKT